MFLKKLEVFGEDEKLIRSVTFRLGVNIIEGNKVDGDDNSSRNSLGKTTLLRAIDFCLGGQNADPFFRDEEFKTDKPEILAFFKQRNPIFRLTMNKVFDGTDDIRVERHVKSKGDNLKITNFINSEKLTNVKFKEELQKVLFNHSEKTPTLRQLLSKFIRIDDVEINSILRFNNALVSDQEYEKIHLFLFGVDDSVLLSQKKQLEAKFKKALDEYNLLAKNYSISDATQIIEVRRGEISHLTEQQESLKIDQLYEENRAKADALFLNVRSTETNVVNLQIEESLLTERLKKLHSDKLEKNSNELAYMYQEAEYYISDKLKNSYEDLVRFHNSMLDNEITYLQNKTKDVQEKISKQRILIESESKKYNSLIESLNTSISWSEYNALNVKINELNIEIGKNEQIKQQLESAGLQKDKIKTELDQKTQLLSDQNIKLQDNLKILNKYLSKNTQELLGEVSFVSMDKNSNGIYKAKFSGDGLSGQLGPGKKQTLVAAFDLAYCQFADELGLYRPRFFTQEKVEAIETKKLERLFDLADSIDCQFIVPVLGDKLAGITSLEDRVILSLDQNNKFFNVDSEVISEVLNSKKGMDLFDE